MSAPSKNVHPAELFALLQRLASHNAARVESAGMRAPSDGTHEYHLDLKLRVNEDALRDFGTLFKGGDSK